jgi:hypothetical protein
MDRVSDQVRSWDEVDGFGCLVVQLLSTASVRGIDVTFSSGNSTIVFLVKHHSVLFDGLTLQQVAAISLKLS